MSPVLSPVLSDARRGHAGLFWFAAAMVALSVALVPVMALDPRTLLGAPLWAKPLKFALSLALYTATLTWLLARLPHGAFRRTGWVVVAAGTLEMVIVLAQAARGVRSHFNDDTDADGMLYNLMGVGALVLWFATAAVAVRFLRERSPDRATALAVRAGLLIALAGMGVGILMSAFDGHAVGVADGGPGLPLVGWSTTGGDLRIGHFVGLHALQALPLLAAALTATRLPAAVRVRLVAIGAAGHAGLLVLLTWQALRGQPLLAPDALTLLAAGALLAAVGLAARHTVRRARPVPVG